MRRALPALLLGLALALAHAPAAAAEPSSKERALKLFQESKDAYRDGRFQDAIDKLLEARKLETEPVLLYNLARAYEGKGDYEAAVQAYEQYVRDAKQIPDRGAIEQRLVSLKKSLEERAKLARERDEAKAKQAAAPAPGPATTQGPQPETPHKSPSAVPWVIAGVGVAGVGVGGVLGAMALSQHGSADKAPSQKDAVSGQDSAKGLALGSTIGLIAGGTIAAVGVTWGIVDVMGKRSADKQGMRSLRLVGSPSALWLEGRFE